MTICREWSLVKSQPEQRLIRPLFCRSWQCEVCAPRRRNQLMAQAASGNPTRFITLTVNPRIGENPADRLRLLARAWRVTVQRLRRRYPRSSIDYLAIVEATKQGEPHLHILFRGPYVPQAYLSECMSEIIDSPIVDIRRVRNVQETIRYVAKYVTKAPAQFGTSKRYWCSRTWEMPSGGREKPDTAGIGSWSVDMRPLPVILREWFAEGYVARQERDELLIAYIPPPGSRKARPAFGSEP